MDSTLYLIVGPSGSGKTTIANKLCELFDLKQIESYTTRPPRYDNERGHIFVTDEEFNRLTDIVAYTEFNGYRYAATADQVEEADIYVIDIAGVEYFKQAYKGSKKIRLIYLDVGSGMRKSRMEARGDDSEAIYSRLANDATEFGYRRREELFKLFDPYDILILGNYVVMSSVMDIIEFMELKYYE